MLVFVQEQIANVQQEVSSADAPLTEDELIQVMGGGCPLDQGYEVWAECRDRDSQRRAG